MWIRCHVQRGPTKASVGVRGLRLMTRTSATRHQMSTRRRWDQKLDHWPDTSWSMVWGSLTSYTRAIRICSPSGHTRFRGSYESCITWPVMLTQRWVPFCQSFNGSTILCCLWNFTSLSVNSILSEFFFFNVLLVWYYKDFSMYCWCDRKDTS